MKDYIEIIREDNKKRVEQVFFKIKDKEIKNILKEWHKELLNRTKGKTPATYLFHVEQFFREVKKPIDKITGNDINGYLGDLKEKGNTSKAKLSYAVLLNFFRYYKDLGKKETPEIFLKVYKPKNTSKDTEPLDYDSEIKPLIMVWGDNVRNQAAIHVLYESMLRKIELLALRVKDIDLSKSPAPIKLRISKTEKGINRHTFLYNSIPVLKEWLNIHPLRSNTNFSNAPLFCKSNGKPMLEGTLRMIIKEAGIRAGIKRKIYPHLFRHSRAYELAQVYHFTPQELKKAGGWSNSSMLDTYYNPNAKDIKNKLLDGHGIKTISQVQREKALRERQVRICACGYENGYDVIFCKGCGIILNIKQYESEIKNKDSEIENLKQEMNHKLKAVVERFEKTLKVRR